MISAGYKSAYQEGYSDAMRDFRKKSSKDMEEIKEVINCDSDAETKCKMISNILTAKPHYFENPTIIKQMLIEANINGYVQGLKESSKKAGHWISMNTEKQSHTKDGMTIESVKCSECDEWLTASDEYACYGRYCPNCGCRMIEPQESEG